MRRVEQNRKTTGSYPDFYYGIKERKPLPRAYSLNSMRRLSSYIHGDVLEIGVGNGVLSAQLLGMAKDVRSYTAVDIYEEFLKDARKRISVKSMDFIQGDFLKIPFYKRFDTIISFEVIEHIQHPLIFLDKIRFLLVEGGIAIVSTPNRVIYDIVATIADGGRDPTHINEMSYRRFNALFGRFFDIVDSVYILPLLPRFSTERLWSLSERFAGIFRFFSLDVVLVGKK